MNRSSAKLALYLSKYIGKDLGEGLAKWQNSYSASGRALPDAIHERVLTHDQTDALAGLIDLLLPEIATGCEFHQAFIEGGGYFLCLSPPDRGRK